MNLFAGETAIIGHLQENINRFRTIGGASGLAKIQDFTAELPACFVFPGASENMGDVLDMHQITERQRWTVIVCVAHIPTDSINETTALSAGELCAEVIRYLAGWVPNIFSTALVYRGREEPGYESGYARFPLIFETFATIRIM